MNDLEARIKAAIADIPDFPDEGILFRDITPLLHDHDLYHDVIDHWADRYAAEDIDYVAGIESRGFIFGAALALHMDVSLALVRKPGKLPRDTYSVEYELEYGTDTLEIHQDALEEGASVVVIDDLLATGGTASAGCTLVERCGANVAELTFLLELAGLKGREKLTDWDLHSLAIYE